MMTTSFMDTACQSETSYGATSGTTPPRARVLPSFRPGKGVVHPIIRARSRDGWGETGPINAERIMISLNDEARKSMLDTLDALRQWSNEIGAINDRCLPKVLDHMAVAEGAMGGAGCAERATGLLGR